MEASAIPHDAEAERQVLGALLLRPELVLQVSSIVQKDDFFFEGHRHVYTAVSDLQNRGAAELDAVQVIHYLQDHQLIEKVGGAPYVMRLPQDVIAPGNVNVHARRLRSLALRRRLMEAANSILEDAGRPSEDENQFLRAVEDRILRITNSSFTQGIVAASELKSDFSQYLHGLIESRGQIRGTASGFRELDGMTSGLKGGELIVLAARPGMGKTTLAMNIATNVAMRTGKAALIFSLEMSSLELMMRLVCSEAQFSHSDLKRGNIPDHQAGRILKAIDRVCAPRFT